MKKIFSIICLCLLAFVATAKNITVKGVVKDSKGLPVIGATVLVDGATGIGTVTDMDGRYSLSVPDGQSETVLVFSCLSYAEQKIAIGKQAVIDVVLQDDTQQLEEVVVVGYGALRRSDLTGSVTSVKINEDDAAKSSSLDQMLEGRAAGVQVLSESASPDAGVTIRVRGIASFSGNTDPLYVVDGIIINGASSSLTTMNVGSNSNASSESTNGLAGINPQDIASIEILKDASATAIYGSQGSNGVVLITTKSANRDVPVIRFNMGLTISQPTKKMDILSFDEYVSFLENYPTEDGRSYLQYIYTDPSTHSGQKVTGIDWQDYVMRTAVSQRYYFAVSGRPKQTNYMFSIGYNRSEGVVERTNSDNITGRLNLVRNFTRNLALSFRTSFGYTKSDLVTGSVSGGNVTSRSSLMRTMMRSKPFQFINPETREEDESLTDADGELMYGPDRWLNGMTNSSERFRVIPSLSLDWKITSWLSFKSSFGGEICTEERIKTKDSKISVGNGNLAGIAEGRRVLYNFDNTLTATKKIKKHSLNLTIGQSASYNSNSVQSITGWNLPQTYARELDINNATSDYSQFDSYYHNQTSLLSFFARGLYNFDERYILTATVRFDGSSKFKGANKWGVFPSLAFAWRITGEPWFNVPVISNAKLRLGWGQVGNQSISSYQTSKTYGSTIMGSHFVPSGKEVVTYLSNISNPDLRWETSNQLNVGLDLGLFHGKLTLCVDAYQKDTWDLLQSKNVALSTGIASVYVNDGTIRNRGLELSLDAVPFKRGSFEWTIGGNMSLNRNTIVSVGKTGNEADIYLSPDNRQHVHYFFGSSLSTSGDTNPLNIFIEGQSMGLFYGYLMDGIVQKGETGYGVGRTVQQGRIKFKDLNGDGKVDGDDRTIIGNPMPKFTYGFNTSISFKKFTLKATFSGAYDFDIFNMNLIQDYETNFSKNCMTVAVRNAWSETNPSNEWPAIGVKETDFCDRYVEDGSNLRLSDLALNYQVPLKKDAKVLHGLNIGFSLGNVFVISKYSGFNPFGNSFGTNVKRMGVDLNSAPYPFSYNFDIKFTF